MIMWLLVAAVEFIPKLSLSLSRQSKRCLNWRSAKSNLHELGLVWEKIRNFFFVCRCSWLGSTFWREEEINQTTRLTALKRQWLTDLVSEWVSLCFYSSRLFRVTDPRTVDHFGKSRLNEEPTIFFIKRLLLPSSGIFFTRRWLSQG